jgi:signal transduction histidine kinase
LIPASSLIKQKIQQLKQYCYPNNIIDVRYIVQMSDTKATILVVDRKISLVMELKDDSKTTFIEAIGLSTYSNSKAGVLSYLAIFENLWRQTELYEQVKDARDSLAQSNKQLEEANEQLKIYDKMQKEFINVAAHELRTPIQPILGLTENLLSHIKDIRQAELLEVVSRSAKRLQRLTEDILDVTKIESQSLNLKKEWFNLNDVIANIVDDALTSDASLKKESNAPTIKLEYHVQNIFVQADKGRITQVISNLLSNALKFTKQGTISINLERKKDDDDYNDYVLISVKDTGQGINPEILPKLFTKFATKGKIRAENNSDSKGATFAFSLPIITK